MIEVQSSSRHHQHSILDANAAGKVNKLQSMMELSCLHCIESTLLPEGFDINFRHVEVSAENKFPPVDC